MKTIQITLITAACLFAMGAAAAAGEQGRSRAEVIAELNAARADGTLGRMIGEDSGAGLLAQQRQPSTLSRAQVIADMRVARSAGEAASLIGEDSGSFQLARSQQPGATRAQVVAQLKAAIASGEAAALVSEDSGSFYLAQREARDRVLAATRAKQQQVARADNAQAGD